MIAFSYIRMIVIAGVLAAMAGAIGYAHHKGAHSVQVKWDAEKVAAANQAEMLRLEHQSAITTAAVTSKAKSEKIRYITKTIIKEVEKYAPANLPMLPPSFRVYHDAAAEGEAIDDTKIADAAPVATSVVAKTVAANYGACNDDKQRLETLQAILIKLGVQVAE